jgi:hypothetical protein
VSCVPPARPDVAHLFFLKPPPWPDQLVLILIRRDPDPAQNRRSTANPGHNSHSEAARCVKFVANRDAGLTTRKVSSNRLGARADALGVGRPSGKGLRNIRVASEDHAPEEWDDLR